MVYTFSIACSSRDCQGGVITFCCPSSPGRHRGDVTVSSHRVNVIIPMTVITAHFDVTYCTQLMLTPEATTFSCRFRMHADDRCNISVLVHAIGISHTHICVFSYAVAIAHLALYVGDIQQDTVSKVNF